LEIDVVDATAGSIAHVIQLSVAPVFLLTAVAGMLGVLTNRLARIVDRSRKIEADVAGQESWRQELLHQWLKDFARRARLISHAISLCIGCALLVGSVVVVLFVSSLFGFNLGALVATMFIAAMISLIGSFLMFLREIYLATQQLRIGQPERPAPLGIEAGQDRGKSGN
jgi:hypothetical protein